MRKLTYIVDVLGREGESSVIIPIVCACVGGLFVLLGLTLCVRHHRRRRRRARAAAAEAGTAQLAQVYPAPPYGSPASPEGATYSPDGCPPCPAPWQGPPLTRADLDAMDLEQLRGIKNEMGLGSYGIMSREHFISVVLAAQAAAAGAPPPAPSPPLKPIPSSSLTNPATGALECGMCFEPMGGGGAGALEAAMAPCGHVYCRPCLTRVCTEGSSRCPACREVFFLFQITAVRP